MSKKEQEVLIDLLKSINMSGGDVNYNVNWAYNQLERLKSIGCKFEDD